MNNDKIWIYVAWSDGVYIRLVIQCIYFLTDLDLAYMLLIGSNEDIEKILQFVLWKVEKVLWKNKGSHLLPFLFKLNLIQMYIV